MSSVPEFPFSGWFSVSGEKCPYVCQRTTARAGKLISFLTDSVKTFSGETRHKGSSIKLLAEFGFSFGFSGGGRIS